MSPKKNSPRLQIWETYSTRCLEKGGRKRTVRTGMSTGMQRGKKATGTMQKNQAITKTSLSGKKKKTGGEGQIQALHRLGGNNGQSRKKKRGTKKAINPRQRRLPLRKGKVSGTRL